jgi:hypothetical protein
VLDAQADHPEPGSFGLAPCLSPNYRWEAHLVSIEILTLDARIVIASVDTYLRFAEAVNRLDLQPQDQVAGLPGLMTDMQESGAKHMTRGALAGVRETASEVASSFRAGGEDQEEEEPSRSVAALRQSGQPRPRRRRSTDEES